jgi:hypothetical protein
MPTVQVNHVPCYHTDESGEECAQTPLLSASLSRKLGYPIETSKNGIAVNFACPHCKYVTRSEIPFLQGSLGIPAGIQYPDDGVPCVVLLECVRRGYRFQVSVLAAVGSGITRPRVEALVREWHFDRGVICEGGHEQTRAGKIVGVAFGE